MVFIVFKDLNLVFINPKIVSNALRDSSQIWIKSWKMLVTQLNLLLSLIPSNKLLETTELALKKLDKLCYEKFKMGASFTVKMKLRKKVELKLDLARNYADQWSLFGVQMASFGLYLEKC